MTKETNDHAGWWFAHGVLSGIAMAMADQIGGSKLIAFLAPEIYIPYAGLTMYFDKKIEI